MHLLGTTGRNRETKQKTKTIRAGSRRVYSFSRCERTVSSFPNITVMSLMARVGVTHRKGYPPPPPAWQACHCTSWGTAVTRCTPAVTQDVYGWLLCCELHCLQILFPISDIHLGLRRYRWRRGEQTDSRSPPLRPDLFLVPLLALPRSRPVALGTGRRSECCAIPIPPIRLLRTANNHQLLKSNSRISGSLIG